MSVRFSPEVMREPFYATQLLVAEQIKHKIAIRQGNCLELSAGNGLLGLTLAQITDLEIYMLGNSLELMDRAADNIKRFDLEERVHLLKGNVRRIPLENQTMHAVVSRSSVFFWQNQIKAFREIFRVLMPGGIACIGGGFWGGTAKRKVEQLMMQYDPHLVGNSVWRQSLKNIEQKLVQAGIDSFEINCSDDGLWIIIRKPRWRQA